MLSASALIFGKYESHYVHEAILQSVKLLTV